MSKLEFVYVTYIETTPEKLWQALTDGDFTERYWFGHRIASDWEVGSVYRFTRQGMPHSDGKILLSDPPKQLGYTWVGCSPESKREGTSRVTFDLEPNGGSVKLTLTHDNLDEGGVTYCDISGGWPIVLSGLKSLMENGRVPSIDLPPVANRETADAQA
jgi:uncharacterized protein YndB with AHSA1/START domain